MRILHISTECYPAAKAGGLGDVVGALPKYLNRLGHEASVVLPKYQTGWIESQSTETVFEGHAPYNMDEFYYSVELVQEPDLGFDLYLMNIPGRFDREGIYIDPWSGYAYWDEMDRFFNFQIASMEWIRTLKQKPEIIHCHDHHTGLVPFMTSQCFRYEALSSIPAVLSIHNGEYQGRYDMENYAKLPAFNLDNIGLLDWDGHLNALAAGIKSAWRVTTVSPGYLEELMEYCHGLESLLRQEKQKTKGLLNGIDTDVWNPKTDEHLEKNFSIRNAKSGKEANKLSLYNEFDLKKGRPLISFIGRLVREKGADLLPDLIRNCSKEGLDVNFLVLGTGDPSLHRIFNQLRSEWVGYFDTRLEYNEGLARRIYAGSDFMIMPSRVEPCGLNQLYAMRYGTVPIVRKTGGLADTVIDISEENGYGIVFDEFSIQESVESIRRAFDFYNEKGAFSENRKRIMKFDFSWETSAGKYEELYKQLNQKVSS